MIFIITEMIITTGLMQEIDKLIARQVEGVIYVTAHERVMKCILEKAGTSRYGIRIYTKQKYPSL